MSRKMLTRLTGSSMAPSLRLTSPLLCQQLLRMLQHQLQVLSPAGSRVRTSGPRVLVSPPWPCLHSTPAPPQGHSTSPRSAAT